MRKKVKAKNKNMLLLAILRVIFFIALIISLIYVIQWYIDSKENEELEKIVHEAVIKEDDENTDNEEETKEYKIDFEKLKNINNDVVAWLKVNGTKVEYPVVKAKDNSYYMNKNLEKKYNGGGWIFADYKNKLDSTDKNIVIYGHNMTDDSMFGSLDVILKEEWYNNAENYIIDFVTEQEFHKYEVFSVYQIKSEDYYIKTEFKGDDFSEFIATLVNRSIKNFEVAVSEQDSILTLSTCADNDSYRIVLHAKKIKE